MRKAGSSTRRRLGIIICAATLVAAFAVAEAQDWDLLAEIEARLIPEEGTETAYGIPLSLDSLPQFIEWSNTLVPAAVAESRFVDALTGLVAPCCDDNTAFRCCCESGGQSCNIIRSGKGLAAYLLLEKGYDTEQVAESVLQWFHFARPDYYLATELLALRKSPIPYGLTAKGSCYRGMCDTPISEGGCGGMKELIEPAIGAMEG